MSETKENMREKDEPKDIPEPRMAPLPPRTKSRAVKPINLAKLNMNENHIVIDEPRQDVNPDFSLKTLSKERKSVTGANEGRELLQKTKPMIFEGGKYRPMTIKDPVDQYKGLGHGVYFYFYTLKFFGFVLIVLSLVCSVALVFNTTGEGLKDFTNIPFWLRTTVVNCPLLITMSIQPLALPDGSAHQSENDTLIELQQPVGLHSKVRGFILH